MSKLSSFYWILKYSLVLILSTAAHSAHIIAANNNTTASNENSNTTEKAVRNYSANSTTVDCIFSLIIPEGCISEEFNRKFNVTLRTPIELTVLNFQFAPEPKTRLVNGKEELDFCDFNEILEFPPNCIAQNTSFRFSDHVHCPIKNSVHIKGPAVWIDSTYYPMYNITYRKDTTGLVMKCFSENILQLSTDAKSQFAGVGVKLGKTKMTNLYIHNHNFDFKNQVENSNWIEIQIPKSLRAGTLEGNSGNYTFYYPDPTTKENIEVQNFEILISARDQDQNQNELFDNTTISQDHELKLRLNPSGVQCTAPNNEDIYLATISGDNPLETRLLLNCLPKETVCDLKSMGSACFQNRPCSNLGREFLKPNGLIFCSHPTAGNITQEYFTGLDVYYYKTDPHKSPSEDLIHLQIDDGKEIMDVIEDDDDEEDDDSKDSQNKTESVENSKKLKVYEKQIIKFECHYQPYILVPSVLWKIRFSNQTVVTVKATEFNSQDIADEKRQIQIGRAYKQVVNIKSAKFSLIVTKDMEEISCSASFWDSSVFRNSSIQLQVLASAAPSLIKDAYSNNKDPIVVEMGQDFKFTCTTNSNLGPPPSFTWALNKKVIVSNDNCIKIVNGPSNDLNGGSSSLFVCNAAGKTHDGTFTCRASNFVGWDEINFLIQVKPCNGSGSHNNSSRFIQ